MKVSQAIAQQNIDWFRNWEQADALPAAALYAGEAFKMLNARSWNAHQWQYASEHLWIGSGLYGLLRATDGIRPYRLEMDVRLPGELQRLSAQWSSILTQFVDQALPKDAVILQLMSDEYARSVHWEALNRPVYAVDFQERTPDGYRSVAVFLKKARGLLADFVIRHQLEDVDQIRAFSGNRYGFVENSLVNNTILFNQF
jgi:cytoplasmic iron level regulating protein YaaA (DUF328/UPF0246 family)